MSEPEEEPSSARCDAASSKRHGKKRPREVSAKRSVSEAGSIKHDVISTQYYGEAQRSFQVTGVLISSDSSQIRFLLKLHNLLVEGSLTIGL